MAREKVEWWDHWSDRRLDQRLDHLLDQQSDTLSDCEMDQPLALLRLSVDFQLGRGLVLQKLYLFHYMHTYIQYARICTTNKTWAIEFLRALNIALSIAGNRTI